MHRIDTPTAQKDKFGAGKNGFTRGNPQTGTPATDLDDDYFDMLQEELVGIIEGAGITLDKSRHDQLREALPIFLGLSKTPGSLINIKLFTTTGNYAPTPGTKKILVRAVGGGAGGGGVPATSSTSQSTAKGGEAGAYIEAYLDVSTLSSVQAIIGAGGSGAVAGSNNGTSGGTTSLGNLISCPGGEPGVGGATSTASFVSSDRASNKSPTVNGVSLISIPTSIPNLGRVANPSNPTVGGTGGSNPLGIGGAAGAAVPGTPTLPTNGSGYGSGGGGGASVGGTSAMGGGNGAPGIIIIMEYA